MRSGFHEIGQWVLRWKCRAFNELARRVNGLDNRYCRAEGRDLKRDLKRAEILELVFDR